MLPTCLLFNTADDLRTDLKHLGYIFLKQFSVFEQSSDDTDFVVIELSCMVRCAVLKLLLGYTVLHVLLVRSPLEVLRVAAESGMVTDVGDVFLGIQLSLVWVVDDIGKTVSRD